MRLAFTFIASALAFTAVLPQPGYSSLAAEEGWSMPSQHDTAERRKKRVKGGSGCDDPGDVAEHPECR